MALDVVGYAAMQIIPSIKNIGHDLAQQLDLKLTEAGKRSGQKMSESMAHGVTEKQSQIKHAVTKAAEDSAGGTEARRSFDRLGRALGTTVASSMLHGVRGSRGQLARALEGEAEQAGKQAGRSWRRAGEKAGEKFAEGAKETRKGLTGAVFGGIGALGVGAIVEKGLEQADLLENANIKVEGSFGESAKGIRAWAATVATQFGLTQTDAENMLGTFGQFFHSMGKGQEEAAGMSEKMVSVVENVAKFNNVDPAKVQSSFMAALRGRGKALAALGINFDSTTLAAEAMSHGLIKTSVDHARVTKLTDSYNMAIERQVKVNSKSTSTDADKRAALNKVTAAHEALAGAMKGSAPKLTDAIKKQAAYYAILDQTKNQQHAVADSADTLTQKKKVLTAQVSNLEAKLGTALLPALTKLATYVSDKVIPEVERFSDWVAKNKSWIEPAAKALLAFFVVFKAAGYVKTAGSAVRGFGGDVAKVGRGIASTGRAIGSGVSSGASAAKSGLDTLRLRAMYAGDALKNVGSKAASGMRTAGSAILNTGKAAGRMAVDVAKAGAAYAKMALQAAASAIKMAAVKAAELATAAATKIWAGVQWLLDAAMNANPISLIVIGIAALVVGIIIAYKHSETFRRIVAAAWAGIKTAASAAWGLLKTILSALKAAIGGVGKAFSALWHTAQSTWAGIRASIRSAVNAVVATVKTGFKIMLLVIAGPLLLAVLLVVKFRKDIERWIAAAVAVVKGLFSEMGRFVRSSVSKMMADISGTISAVGGFFSHAFGAARDAISSAFQSALAYVRGIPGEILSGLGDLSTLLLDAGKHIIDGLVNGIKGAAGSAVSAVTDTAKSMVGGVTGFLGIHSPSRVFHDIGKNSMDGLTNGISANSVAAQQAAVLAASSAASGAKKAAAAASKAAKHQASLDASDARKAAAAQRRAAAAAAKDANAAFKLQQQGAGLIQALADGIASGKLDSSATENKIRSFVGKLATAVHNGVSVASQRTVQLLNAENARFSGVASRAASIATSVAAATANLNARLAEYRDKSSSIAQGVTGQSGLAGAGSGETDAFGNAKRSSASNVLAAFKAKAQRAVAFAHDLILLRKQGLAPNLIDELAQAGPDGAMDQVEALVHATKSQIRTANGLASQISTAASATGEVAAKAMFQGGVDAAKGLVKGLQSQQKSIDRQMVAIARSMERTIRSALGIHSPSRVMAALGEYAALGLGDGMNNGRGHIIASAKAAADAMLPKAGHPIWNRPADPRQFGGGGDPAEQHLHHHWHVDQAPEDPQALAADLARRAKMKGF